MNGSHDRQDSDAEDHVVASLEQRKQQMHAVPKDSAMQRISHLPMLLKRMKSTSIRPDDDGDDHDEGELRLSKAGHAKEYPKLPPPRRSDNNGQKSTKKWFERRGRQPKTDKDAFFDNALHLQTLMKEDSDTSDDTDDDESVSTTADDDVEYGGETLTEKSNLLKKKKRQKKRRKMKSKLRSQWRRLMVTLRPEDIQVTILEFLRKDVTLIMLPMLTVAFILYYLLDNPDLVFLPNSATLAWYLLFVVRLQVTFALARVSQFLLEIVSIRTSLLAQWSGPFVTLVAMQSLGWPFLLLAWGVWNILILHGSSPFIRHWLCFTGMAIFSPEHNPDGDGVLQSEIYGRILSTLVCVGALSALKRTTVALYLSRRMLSNYKPQLIKTMNEVHLITGIAGLAAEADKPGFDELVEEASQDAAAQIQMDRKVKYMDDVPTFSSSDDDNKQSREVLSSFEKLADNKQGKRDQWKALKDQALHNDPTEAAKDAAVRGGHTDEKLAARRFDHVMSTLDRWEPPSEPNEKVSAESSFEIIGNKLQSSFETILTATHAVCLPSTSLTACVTPTGVGFAARDSRVQEGNGANER